MKSFSSIWVFVCCILFLTACEEDFAGNKASNIEIVNGPYRMRLLNVGGSKLAVLNTNYRFLASEGSLHFYNPGETNEVSDLTLTLPSNASDFVFYDDTLFVADRNENQLLLYDYSGGSFSQRMNSGLPVTIETLSNPQRLLQFSGTVDDSVGQEDLLAIVCQTTGTVQFLRLSSLEFVTSDVLDTAENQEAQVLFLNQQSGTYLEMIAKRIEDSSRDDRINVPLSAQVGRGINEIVSLGGANEVLVFASYTYNALFGFRFKAFDNNSNFVWDLDKYRKGFKKSNGDKFEGSDEEGFRGLAADGNGNVFASSRTDNRVYLLEAGSFDQDRIARSSGRGRNTRGYDKDARNKIINIEFDDDDTDKTFPRLGPIAVNAAGDTFWVLGLETDKVYRVADDSGGNWTSMTRTDSASSALGQEPQALLLDEANSLLYVANTRSNSISVLDMDSLALQYKIEN